MLDQEISLRSVDQGVQTTHELVQNLAFLNPLRLGELCGVEVEHLGGSSPSRSQRFEPP